MLLTLAGYFGGDLNAVEAVIEYTDLTTATLNIVMTLGYVLLFGLFVGAFTTTANPSYPASVRKQVAGVGWGVVLIAAYIVPIAVMLLFIAAGIVLHLRLAHKNAKAIQKAKQLEFEDWVATSTPSDTKLSALHAEAGRLTKALESRSSRSPAAERIRDRLGAIHLQVNARQTAMHAAMRPTFTDAIYSGLIGMLSANILIWFIQVPPLGPTYQVQYWNGEQRVMHILDKGKDKVLVIDKDTRRPEVIPKTLIQESKLCIRRRSFIERPIAAIQWSTADARGAVICHNS
jgi:hypothetical protein